MKWFKKTIDEMQAHVEGKKPNQIFGVRIVNCEFWDMAIA